MDAPARSRFRSIHAALVPVLAICALAFASSAHAEPVPRAPAVINGTQVTAAQMLPTGRWSSLTALVSASEPNAWYGQFCGGTLIRPGWVLTAAHCVFGDFDNDGDEEVAPAASIDAVLGRRDLTTSAGARIRVAAVVPYPGYAPGGNTDSDLALLKLTSDVPATVALPIGVVGAGDAALWAPGQQLFVAGWGNRAASLCPAGGGACTAGTPDWPRIPDQAAITRVADPTCATGPSPGYAYFVSSTMVCAGVVDTDGVAGTTNGRDTCQGDSGGPLVADPGTGVAGLRLVGATSFGRGCGSVNYGVYTRLANFGTWITAYADGSVPVEPEPTGDAGGGGSATPEPAQPAPATPLPRELDEPEQPGLPQGVRVTRRTLTSVAIAWDAPATGTPVAGYAIDWGLDSADLAPHATTLLITGIAPGTALEVSIRAYDAADATSDEIILVTSTVRDTRGPVLAAAPGVKRAGKGATITWRTATDDHKVASYRVVAKVGSKWKTLATVAGSKRALKLRALPPRTSAIAVQPVDASGNVGARSKAATVRR